MSDRLDETYLKMAAVLGAMSRACRNKVGALVVLNRRIIAEGYNGTPSGWDNKCEDVNGDTLPEVLHAEANAIAKLACSTQSCEGATLYTTLAPCFECAKLIAQAKIKRVVWGEQYRDPSGLEFLRAFGVEVSRPDEVPLVPEVVERVIDVKNGAYIERFLAREDVSTLPVSALDVHSLRVDVGPGKLTGITSGVMTFSIQAASREHALLIAGVRIGRAFYHQDREVLEAVLNIAAMGEKVA